LLLSIQPNLIVVLVMQAVLEVKLVYLPPTGENLATECPIDYPPF